MNSPSKEKSVPLSDIMFGKEYWHKGLRAKVMALCTHPHDGASIVYSYWSPCGNQEKFDVTDRCFLYELRDDIVFGNKYWHSGLQSIVIALCTHPHDSATIGYSYWPPHGERENFGITDKCFLCELRDDIRTVWQVRGSFGANDIHCGTFSTRCKANKYVSENDGKLDPNAHLEHGSGRGIVHSMYICRISLDKPDFPKSNSGADK